MPENVKRQVEEHRRKVQQEIEAARRRLKVDGAGQPHGAGNGAAGRSNSTDRRAKLPTTFKYAFNDGREFAYAFDLHLKVGSRKPWEERTAGIAVFQANKDLHGRWEVLARDNIQAVSASGAHRRTPQGQKTTMLSRVLNVDVDGDEPSLDGNLPALLGNLGDWFFPPIVPYVQTEARGRGRGMAVVRTDTGKWRDVGFYDPDDESARGYYEWGIKPLKESGGVLSVEDTRTLRNRIGSIELAGRGTFAFERQTRHPAPPQLSGHVRRRRHLHRHHARDRGDGPVEPRA